MLLRPQRAPVTAKFVTQGAVAPGARLSSRKTIPAVKSSPRTTLVSVTLPQLLTIPLKVMVEALLAQRNTRLVLQTLVTARQGLLPQTTQVLAALEALIWTPCPL